MWIEIQTPHHNSGNGTENITSMACSTSAFSFAKTTPELPVSLPNTSTIDGSIALRIFFNTPSSHNTGPSDFTVLYNQYP